MTAIDCSIVTPVFNRVELTRQCLETLFGQRPQVSLEIVIVDNGSSDGTDGYLDSLGTAARVIRNRENLGFAKACNQGARCAVGDYLVFLNNDTIPLPGWLDELVATMRSDGRTGAVGSRLLYPDGTVQHAGMVFGPHAIPYHIYRHAPGSAPYVNKQREVAAVTGACMLVARRTFLEMDGFDEGYRNGFEDVDLCLRLRRRGLKIKYCPASALYHLESMSPGRSAFDGDNLQYFLARWAGGIVVDDETLCRQDGTDVWQVRRQSWMPARHLLAAAAASDTAPTDCGHAAAQTGSSAARSAPPHDASGNADGPSHFTPPLDRSGLAADAVRPSFTAEAEALAAFDAGQAHAEAGRLPEAKSDLNRALNLNPMLASAHYLLGYVDLEQGNVQEALRSLRQAVGLAPDAADFHSALGVALHQAGDHSGAEAALRRALEIDDQRADLWCNLAELFDAQGRSVEAAAARDRASVADAEQSAGSPASQESHAGRPHDSG